MSRVDEMDAERLDERRLAGAGRAADADSRCAARERKQRLEQLYRVGPMVAARRFDECDRPRQQPPRAGSDGVGELRRRHAAWRRSPISTEVSDAACEMLLRGS